MRSKRERAMLKVWTVVIELIDDGDPRGYFDKDGIEEMIEECLRNGMHAGFTWRIMETIEAPYGPQGVIVKEFQPCICAKNFPRNPLCKARVHVK